MLTAKQKTTTGGIFTVFGLLLAFFSIVAVQSSDNLAILALLFLSGIIAGVGATLAVVGLFEKGRRN